MFHRLPSLTSLLLVVILLSSCLQAVFGETSLSNSRNSMEVARSTPGEMLSMVTPDPRHADPKTRSLTIQGATELTSQHLMNSLNDNGISQDSANSLNLNGIGTGNGKIIGGVWVYFTTSDPQLRSNLTADFDDAYEEMTSRLTQPGRPMCRYVDCAKSKEVCEESLWRSISSGMGVAPSNTVRDVLVDVPSLLYIKFHDPCLMNYDRMVNECAVSYHFLKLPLREKGWQRNVKLELDADVDGKTRKVVVPAFPSALEQMRNAIMGRQGDWIDDLWGEEGEWGDMVTPYVHGNIMLERFQYKPKS